MTQRSISMKFAAEQDISEIDIKISDTEKLEMCSYLASTFYKVSADITTERLTDMIENGWIVKLFVDPGGQSYGVLVCKPCMRMHSGNVLVIDTLVCSHKRTGMGTHIIERCVDMCL